jgi:hypothetical protein
MEDPQRRPYFVFWTTRLGEFSYRVRITQVADGAAVKLSTPERTSCRIDLVRRPMPRWGGMAVLYRCPCCNWPRRHLYGLALIGGRSVEDGLWRCRQCAGLLFVSQGRYQRQFRRAVFAAFYGPDARIREPLPRHPWDPQAVSDPRMLVDEFPDQFQRVSSLQYRS